MFKIAHPQVTLVASTPSPFAVIMTAINMTGSGDSVPPIEEITDTGLNKRLVKKTLASDTSVLEHIQFTFTVSGISLDAEAQLLRNCRHCAYTGQGKRAIDASKLGVVVPQEILDNVQALDDFTSVVDAANRVYCEIVDEQGIRMKYAKYIMPICLETRCMVTYDARELFDTIFPLFLYTEGDDEVKAVAIQMYKFCAQVLPSVFRLVPDKRIGENG